MMDQVIRPTSISPRSYLAAEVILDVVTAIIVITRLVWNYHRSGKLFSDDYLCAFALLLIGTFSGVSVVLNSTFFRKPSDVSMPFLTSIAAAGICTGTAAMYFAKLPLLVLIIRLFKVNKTLRYISYVLMAVTAAGFLGASLLTIVRCSPGINKLGDPFLFGCVEATIITGLTRNSLSLVADIIIFVLPLRSVAQLHLPLSKKIGLAVVFMFGSFAIVASIVSLYFQAAQISGKSSSYTTAALVTAVECCIIVIVSCAPAFRVLGSQCISSLRTSKSFHSFAYSKSPSRTLTRNNPSNKREPRVVASHEYIELDDHANLQSVSYTSQNRQTY
ncbi:hypothetical protein GGR51DRAFT_537217, partial [Nemania sp. FL0031]